MQRIRIAHLSDVHVLDLTGTTLSSLMNKRITGLANIFLRRGPGRYPQSRFIRALDICLAEKVDHVLLSGDVSNLALASEFSRVHQILEEQFESNLPDAIPSWTKLSIVPGNHDAYIPEAKALLGFKSSLSRFIVPVDHIHAAESNSRPQFHSVEDNATGARVCFFSDADGHFLFPVVKEIRDRNLMIVCFNTAVPRPPFSATGRISTGQRARLEYIMNNTNWQNSGLFKVCMLHHPAVDRYQDKPDKRRSQALEEDSLEWIQSRCEKYQIQLALHGHTHVAQSHLIPNSVPTHVVDCGSTTQSGVFNIYEIDHRLQMSIKRMSCDESGLRSIGF
eukprot:ANDGO_03594.mRNA.1 hypothetical protein H696_02998